MKPASDIQGFVAAIVSLLTALGAIWLVFPFDPHQHDKTVKIKITSEMRQLVAALERCRNAYGEYPPASTRDPKAVRQFLAKAFPKYRGELPENYKNLDAAASLVFWLVGMTDKDGKMIGFSADPRNPFDATNGPRIGPFFEFDPARLRSENGLPVYLPPNGNSQSEPYVYFRPDSKGEYHDAWKNCCPCRDSAAGGYINPKSFQLFAPGLGGKYGSGVQYPSGTDYDAERQGNMSNFTSGPTLGDDMR